MVVLIPPHCKLFVVLLVCTFLFAFPMSVGGVRSDVFLFPVGLFFKKLCIVILIVLPSGSRFYACYSDHHVVCEIPFQFMDLQPSFFLSSSQT